jgi:hypothetical protein
MKTLIKSPITWLILFGAMLILGMDFYHWRQETSSIGLFGYPGWFYFFIGLQWLLVALYAIFAKVFWKGKEDEPV